MNGALLLVLGLRHVGQRAARPGQEALEEAGACPGRQRRPEPERRPEQLGQRQDRHGLEQGGRLAG
eukprot:1036795-Lingulodinium_polyedra.AAC.1